MTLQRMVLSQQGVCTEPWLFYNFDGPGRVSESTETIYLPPEARLRTDTFVNMVGLGSWDKACQLDGLYLAVLGSGIVEIKVYQVTTGRSWERLVCEVCELSPTSEVVIDLSHYMLNGAEGCIWFELTNCSDEDFATVTGARYLTRGQIDPAMKLALCVSKAETTSPQDDLARNRLRAWTGTPLGLAAAAGLVETPATTPALDQLNAAKAAGFSHALVLDPTTVVDRESLDRAVVFLSQARGPGMSLGAAVLDSGEKWVMGANGMTLDLNDKPTPYYQGTDLRQPLQVIAMESEQVADTEGKLLFQPEFLALCLKNLPKRQAVTGSLGFDAALRAKGFSLVQLTGIIARRDSEVADSHGDLITLQHAIYPEPGLCTEVAMFYHANGPTTFKAETGTLSIEQGSIVHFDSYFNALNIGKWHANCEPEGLYLGLKGRGRVLVKVFHAIPDRSWELLCNARDAIS